MRDTLQGYAFQMPVPWKSIHLVVSPGSVYLYRMQITLATAVIVLHRGHNWVSHVKGSKPSVPLLVISIFSTCSLRDPVCQQIEVGAGMGWSTTMVCAKRLLSILESKFTFAASEELRFRRAKDHFSEMQADINNPVWLLISNTCVCVLEYINKYKQNPIISLILKISFYISKQIVFVQNSETTQCL